jgi:hypothetical protein
LLNKWTVEEEYLAGEIDTIVRLVRRRAHGPAWLRPFRQWRLMQHLSELLGDIDRYRTSLSRRVLLGSTKAGTARPERQSLLRKLRAEPADRATLVFRVLPDRVLTILVQRWRLDFALSAMSRIELRNLVRRWHEMHGGRVGLRDLGAAEIFEMSAEADPAAASAALMRGLALNAALDIVRPRVRALAIMPDDVLHGFPFAAIRWGKEYLVERFALSVGFGTALPAAARRDSGPAVFVGVSRGTSSIPELPATRREVVRLKEDFARRGVVSLSLLDEAVDRGAVLAMLGKAHLFHIACHGRFRPDAPDQSGLILVPWPNHDDSSSCASLPARTWWGWST